MENKLKHLEMVQGVITRMAGNSFLLKGWTVVLISAILALSSSESNSQVVYLAYLPAAVFWLLDGFFLRQERLFGELYDDVRAKSEDAIDFCMDTAPFESKVQSWLAVAFSKTLRLFHGVMFLAITAVWLVPVVLDCLKVSKDCNL